MTRSEQFAQVLLRCKASPQFFIENFCKVRHPAAGVLPFHLHSYQRRSLDAFRKHRFNLYKKTRQCGISTLAGGFTLWYSMFYNHKTVLVVSKGDRDSVEFLEKNIKFVYRNLPGEFHEVYGDINRISNEHAIKFPNGTTVKCLPSGKDVLRSNSASLNIIDEAGFMPDMDAMWGAGWPTLQHGGSCIVISTANGEGNWYHMNCMDAAAKRSIFNLIEVNWWDMDWTISYKDDLDKRPKTICPRAGIRKCETKEEKTKYGPYWSPWLEEQYIALQKRGEAHLFRQEILAEFVGTGNTVLPPNYLISMGESISPEYKTVSSVEYVHPVSDDKLSLNFENHLWVWKKPVKPTPPVVEHGRIIRPGDPGHIYSVGIDISSGEDVDFSAVEVFDHTTREQVAELNIKVLPTVLAMMVDYIGRWYNLALVIPERTGMGAPVTQSIHFDLGYPNIYRMKLPNGKLHAKVGFPTSPTYKPMIVKALLDNLDPDNGGYKIYSQRLYDQLRIFVHLGRNKVGSVKGVGNHDDLSMAAGFALVGGMDAMISDSSHLLPTRQDPNDVVMSPNEEDIRKAVATGGIECLMPVVAGQDSDMRNRTPMEEFDNFMKSLGGIQKGQAPVVVQRKNQLKLPNNSGRR